MWKTKREAEDWLSHKYNKIITFSEPYQNTETLQFHVNLLVDGRISSDKQLIENIQKDIEANTVYNG